MSSSSTVLDSSSASAGGSIDIHNGASEATTTTATGGGSAQHQHHQASTAPILARLKELEAMNQSLAKSVEDAKAEAQAKEEKIKVLSADKRKEMEQLIETAIDTWLNSLTGVSDEVRKQFRSGVSRIAENADMQNAAWEVVCQASALHRANVNRIEELLSTCNQQTETIKSLVGTGGGSGSANDASFASEASRITGGAPPPSNNKRARLDNEAAVPPPQQQAGGSAAFKAGGAGGGDAWDMFSSMLRDDSRSVYF